MGIEDKGGKMQSTVPAPDGHEQVCYLTVVRRVLGSGVADGSMRPHEGVSAFQIDPLGILKEARSNNRVFGPFGKLLREVTMLTVDHIFTPSTSNEDVFKDVLQPLLEGEW